MVSVGDPLHVAPAPEMERLPCTCTVGQEPCAACRAWARRQHGPVRQAPKTQTWQVAQVRRRLKEARQRQQEARVRELVRQLKALGADE